MTSENSESETMMKTEISKNYDYYSKNKKFVESKFGYWLWCRCSVGEKETQELIITPQKATCSLQQFISRAP